jgi:hypothetical protein
VACPTVIEPDVGCSPDHAPEAVQVVTLEADQVSVAAWSVEIGVGETAIETTGDGVLTVSVADCAVDPPAPVHVRVYE